MPINPPPAGRLYRWTPLIIATLLVMAVTPLFWLTDLDLRAAAWFYRPGLANVWPHEYDALWIFFYEASWIFGLLIVLGSVALLVAARRGLISLVWRPRSWAILLVLVLGVGLVVNVGFKDNFGRYRPRQIENFDGSFQYQVPWQPGIPGTGKSFPAGHPSPVFGLTIFYFIWRGRRPVLAWTSLGIALGVGGLMGVGRMAAGAHFLSDVIWSGWFMFATASLTYYQLVRVPEKEARIEAGEKLLPMSRTGKLVSAGLLGVAVAAALFAKPIGEEFSDHLDADELAGLEQLVVEYDSGELSIEQIDGNAMQVDVVSRSFGVPGAQVRIKTTELEGVWRLDIAHRGRFTEKGTQIRLRLPASAADKLVIQGPHEAPGG